MNYHGDYHRLLDTVKAKLDTSGSCHDFDHTLRVMNNAEKLLEYYPQADKETVMLAALLHDIARPEEEAGKGKCCHAELGGKMVPELLEAHGFQSDLAQAVSRAVSTHRFRSKNEPETLEAEIVFDADKLDSLGAAGIGRAFLFAGRENARLHNRAEEALAANAYSKDDTAFREYLVKLQYLPRRMRSSAGRKMAVSRAAFMADFFEQLNLEVYGNSDNMQK